MYHFWLGTYVALGVDVANVGGNTWAALDVVKSKLRDTWVELQEEGEGLANTTSRAKDSDLGGLLITRC